MLLAFRDRAATVHWRPPPGSEGEAAAGRPGESALRGGERRRLRPGRLLPTSAAPPAPSRELPAEPALLPKHPGEL